MIRVSASMSKKVPLPGVEFSSQQFGASLEIEAADEKPEVLRAKLQELYLLLNQAVDQQIAAVNGHAKPTVQRPQVAVAPMRPRWNAQGNGGNGHGQPHRRMAMATQAQQRAIVRICESQGLDVQAILADCNADHPSRLTLKQASNLIDQLKARRA